MEKRGLVTRIRDSGDRRAYRIALTNPGERLGADAHESVLAELETLIGDAPSADRDRLTAMIVQLLGGHDTATGRA